MTGAAVSSCHTQKVAGISGSESHLLQLLPDLRERAAGLPLSHVARGRAGGMGVRRRVAHAWSPARRCTAPRRRRPPRLRGSRRVPLAHATPDPPHAPRPRRCLRPARGLPHPRPVPTLDEARVQRVSGRTLVRARGSVCRLPRARSHRDLTGARAVPRETEGFAEEDFEIVHYGIASDGPAAPTCAATPGCSASAA